MKVFGRTISKTVVALLAVVGLLSAALGVVLYVHTVPMEFSVSTEYGLELWDETQTTLVTAISWEVFNPDETKSQNFYLKNVGNEDVNVACILGTYDETAWTISHDFADQTVLKDGWSVLFTITITEVEASAEQTYSCDVKFEVVDSFSSPDEVVSFDEGSREVEYKAATAEYLEFVSDSFNKTPANYTVGENIEYNFTTKAIKSGGNLVAWEYSLYVEDSTGEVVKTVEFKKHITCDLAYGETIELTHTFTMDTVGIYHMNLTYELADWSESAPLGVEVTFDTTNVELRLWLSDPDGEGAIVESQTMNWGDDLKLDVLIVNNVSSQLEIAISDDLHSDYGEVYYYVEKAVGYSADDVVSWSNFVYVPNEDQQGGSTNPLEIGEVIGFRRDDITQSNFEQDPWKWGHFFILIELLDPATKPPGLHILTITITGTEV